MDSFRTILERCPAAVYLFDLDRRANRFANRSVEELVGWGAEALASFGDRLLDTILHADDAARVEAHFEQLRDAADGVTLPIRYRMRTPDGSFRWLESRDTPFERGPDGRTRLILGVATDATERVAEEERLRSSEERFRLLAENARELICLHEPDGRYRYVSPVARRLLGYDPESLVGQDPYGLFHPEDAERIRREAHEPALEAATDPPTVRYRLRRADGTYALLETTTVPLLQDGVVRALQTVSRDVTELRRLEQRLANAERLRAVGRLAAGVAHDFNNVLMAVRANLEELAARPGESGRIELLGEAIEALSRADLLTRRLLAIGQRGEVDPAPLELGHAVVELSERIGRLLAIAVDRTVVSEPCWARVDYGALEQILLNLLSNARDAAPGRPVRVELRTETRAGQRYATVAVRDSGSGIAPDLLDRIFEPFFSTKPDGIGTGLGLATVKALTEDGGGEVLVTSTPGAGTEFCCRFPLLDAPAAPTAVDQPSTPAARILVVEDDAAVCRVVARVLQRSGYRVETAADGAEALDKLRAGVRPDAIVSDVYMPRLDGPGLIHAARADGLAIRAVFMTGHVPAGDIKERLDQLDEPLLRKPFHPDTLLRALAERLRAGTSDNDPA